MQWLVTYSYKDGEHEITTEIVYGKDIYEVVQAITDEDGWQSVISIIRYAE